MKFSASLSALAEHVYTKTLVHFKRFNILISKSYVTTRFTTENGNTLLAVSTRYGIRLNFRNEGFAFYRERLDAAYLYPDTADDTSYALAE